ncbi:tRNA dimethylallyltransferase [Desulfacinum hydrothermale DSM 13146]|uniref:tRNA dimethylallyltransferase n=1 Tax=Desulfacinum hydrothermale DSM 13146 TaxID=1121390 RepID=A0A1W1XKW4_9BACT|nr:tRNA (adenosine(37)-N6)-dimethylallyltransferase MiaA [Desulfacinum hydrothermale]SMC24138.1 tRNA dimethylallyltransferase [Desulfacinum hydrothermale DSM 13146]
MGPLANEQEHGRRLPIVLLAGPTAVGKTSLALDLARRMNTQIVNADSMQVYRHMDIGTAKPTAEEQRLVPHHLLDVVDPDEPFDAARYVEMARPIVDHFHQRGRIPLVVGGTGLYMKALTRGLCPGAPSDPEIRRILSDELAQRGSPALHRELCQVDPELGRRLHPNDRQRILRALEVYRATGKPLSHWQAQHRFQDRLYPSIKVALFREREELYDRINRRTLIMMEQGFLEEVRKLLSMGYDPSLKPMQSLGYRHLCDHLLGKRRLDEAVSLIQRDTRRYAKRQLTWFKGDPEFQWFHAEDHQAVLQWVQERIRAMQQ